MRIRRTLGFLHPNTRSLSFVAVERQSAGVTDVPMPTSSNKVMEVERRTREMEKWVALRDLRAGENPCKGTKETQYVHVQSYNTARGENLATHTRPRINEETAGVVSERIVRMSSIVR